MLTLENAVEPARKTELRFEDFAGGDGRRDLFEKADALEAFLRSRPSYTRGLGLQMLGAADRRVPIVDDDGTRREVVMLGSNSYLSLTTDPRVVAAAKAACDEYGYGMGAVSLYAGTTDLHKRLEAMIAGFYGTEDALIFPSGYSANVGVISSLCAPGDVVINDASNHASIFDGAKLSGAEVKVFLHRNTKHLERILSRLPDAQKGRLIVTDGVFSMDGDIAPLAEIVGLARRWGARVLVDEAHALGVVGATGRGTAELEGCAGNVDLTVGTLSKVPGAIGGYCAGSRNVITYLRYYARTYFFSTSIPAPVIAGLIEVFRILRNESTEREKLWRNIGYLLTGLTAMGFNTGDTRSAIIPVIVGDEEKLGRFNNELRRRGVFTNLVSYPAVRRKECRLRVSVMSSLTREDMDHALRVFGEVGRELGIIP
jgi:glycine C-acetyltransferase